MRLLLIAALALLAWPPVSDFGAARRWMEEGTPERAVEVLEEIVARKPEDPWALYNLAVAAYAAKDYRKADDLWQRLATMELPEKLRDQVWFQIGNASFRLAEPGIATEPDRSLAYLEQSREAYRVAIAQNANHPGAARNLHFVEQRLESLNAELTARLIAEAQQQAEPEPAIEKLQSAKRYLQAATALNPEDPKYRVVEGQIKQLLAVNHTKVALRSERKADQHLADRPDDSQKRASARGEFERGLRELQQALGEQPEYQPAKEGQGRLTGKLADLLAGNGRRSQKEGQQLAADKKIGEALERYEGALKSFEEALGVQQNHQDAQAGREEVKQAMEQLHLTQGDRHMALGEKQGKDDPGPASENLLKAMDHFQQAQGLHPGNEATQQRIDRVNGLLPDVLVAFAKQDQERASEVEPTSIPKAIAYLERAESTYVRALEIAPDHAEAKAGLEQVRADLERLRKKLPPPKQDKKESQQSRTKTAREKLASMLNKLRSAEKTDESDGRGQRVRIIREGPGASYRDW
jgi:tetratricopeptide (TPR) repeat protein